jgi:hypothetical protein
LSAFQEPATRGEVESALRDVLARSDFQEDRSLLMEFLDWLAERFELGQGAAAVGEVLFWTLIGILTALTIYFVIRFATAGRVRRRQQLEGEARPGPSTSVRVSRLRREAAAARAAGDLRLALRKNLFALILGLGGRGELEYRDAWTNRELLFRGKPAPEMREMLASVVTELEAKEFGHEQVFPGDVNRLEELCEQYLGVLEEIAA